MTAQTATSWRTAAETMMALGGRLGVPQTYPPTLIVEDWTGARFGGTFPARKPRSRPCPRAPFPSAAAGTVHPSRGEFPRLCAAHWPTGAYRRERLPERVLQFGTGMLLRALCAASVDAANSAGAFSGRVAVIQSTPQGQARAINAQDGLFTLVDRLADGLGQGPEFREWLGRRVRFCSSLVDRITTGMPAPDVRAALERRLGYTDALLTVTEPHALWAIEADPAELRATFAIDVSPESMVIAPDIRFYRERKLRLLNGAHTATAPLALLAGVRTVREAAEHPRLGAFLRHILFDEIVPATDLPGEAAVAFAETVIDRFRNPWLDHEWRVIAANQTAKLRARFVPSLAGFARKRGIAPQGLALGLAAYLRWVRSRPAGDADLPLIERHWRTATALQGLTASALADADLWGLSLAGLPGLLAATTRSLVLLERDGVDAALDALPGMPLHAATGPT